MYLILCEKIRYYLSNTIYMLDTLSSIINSVPANEIDNYLRPFLLLPLLSIRFTNKDLMLIVYCLFYLLHYLFIFNDIDNIRYGGTSSSPITYANLFDLDCSWNK